MPARHVFASMTALVFARFRPQAFAAVVLLLVVSPGVTAESQARRTMPVRGVIMASWEAVVSAQVSERVLSLPFKEGNRFGEGDELLVFDCVRLDAEARAQKALFEAKSAVHSANERRAARGAAGSLEVEISRAERAASQGQYEAARSLLRDCSIKAPFAGRILQRHISVFEVPAQNSPLLTIVKDGDLEVHMIAPSQWLSWLDVGAAFEFKIDETGETYEGRVSRLGAAVDPVSQTVKLIGHLEGADDDVISGMSGNAFFEMTRADRADAGSEGTVTR